MIRRQLSTELTFPLRFWSSADRAAMAKCARFIAIILISFFFGQSANAAHVPLSFRIISEQFNISGAGQVRQCPPGRGEVVECASVASGLQNAGRSYGFSMDAFSSQSGVLDTGIGGVFSDVGIDFVIRLELAGATGARGVVRSEQRHTGVLQVSGSNLIEAEAGSSFQMKGELAPERINSRLTLIESDQQLSSTETQSGRGQLPVNHREIGIFRMNVGDLLTLIGSINASSSLSRITASSLALGGTATADFANTFFSELSVNSDDNLVPIGSTLYLVLLGISLLCLIRCESQFSV